MGNVVNMGLLLYEVGLYFPALYLHDCICTCVREREGFQFSMQHYLLTAHETSNTERLVTIELQTFLTKKKERNGVDHSIPILNPK